MDVNILLSNYGGGDVPPFWKNVLDVRVWNWPLVLAWMMLVGAEQESPWNCDEDGDAPSQRGREEVEVVEEVPRWTVQVVEGVVSPRKMKWHS